MMLIFLLIVLYIVGNVGATEKLTKQPLVDRKLCNNDPNNKLQQKCYDAKYNEEKKCDTREIAPENCSQLKTQRSELSNSILADIGQFVDHDSTIRRITIELTKKDMDLIQMGDNVDSFLIPRPMWSVVQEPYNVTDTYTYVFERYSQLWDPYYADLMARQFPQNETCAKSKIVIGRNNCVHPGYSDVRKAYFKEVDGLPAIFDVYVPADPPKMDGHSTTGFMSDSDCPANHTNRWSCAFLPMTNCTIPLAARHDKHDTVEMFSSATESGKIVSHGAGNRKRLIEMGENLAKASNKSITMVHSLPHFVYTSPFSHAANMFQFHGPEDSQVQDFLFMEFLFRKTAFYRRKAAEMFAQFRAKYNLGDHVRTDTRRFVGVHIRRDDRIVPGVNMTEICHNIIMSKIEGVNRNCTYGPGKIEPCPLNGDRYGCERPGDVGIGEVTLDGVVKEAELLIGPTIRNMIIFTEDLQWVNKEMSTLNRPDWKFFIMDPPSLTMSKHTYFNKHKHEDVHDFKIRSSGTLSGVYFHATIDLAQECDAFIGHFNSGVAMTLAGAMCHHHAGMEGICPPVYNLKLGM